jgi:hypothetical protein
VLNSSSERPDSPGAHLSFFLLRLNGRIPILRVRGGGRGGSRRVNSQAVNYQNALDAAAAVRPSGLIPFRCLLFLEDEHLLPSDGWGMCMGCSCLEGPHMRHDPVLLLRMTYFCALKVRT